MGTGLNNNNYPYVHNYIYSFISVLTFDCGMFVFILCILFVCWSGMYIVVTLSQPDGSGYILSSYETVDSC